ncbi:MAG: hypothetical protein ACRDZ4_00155 [Egibacteraceae bacterium]
MLNLDEQIGKVWNPDVRPLVAEAYRCYATGAARACIALTWVAVCADLIEKVSRLAEDGEGAAAGMVSKIEAARKRGLDAQAVKMMQDMEREILDKATELELIDSIDQRELERLREDRHLCAHPSLRPLGEFYEPRVEQARAHLAAALEIVLTHSPSQGQKAMARFRNHLIDPSFTESSDYLMHAFFDNVRTATRRRIVNLAVKHAMLELPPPSVPKSPDSVMLANRMTVCVKAFIERDRGMVRDAAGRNVERLRDLPGEIQIRTLGRLGDIDVFWELVDEPTRSRFEDLIKGMYLPEHGRLSQDYATVLSLVAVDVARSRIPALEERFSELADWHQVAVIARRPSQYFASLVPQLLEKAWDFRSAELIAEQIAIPCGRFLTAGQLKEALTNCATNNQCWYAARMPDLSVEFYTATAHLRSEDKQIWQEFIKTVRSNKEAVDWYYYTELEAAINASGKPRSMS